jgi:hypothetical protein
MRLNSGQRGELAGKRNREKRVGLHVAPSDRKIQACWPSSASSVGSTFPPISFSIFSSISHSRGSFLSLGHSFGRSHYCWPRWCFKEFRFYGDGTRGQDCSSFS